MVCVRPGVVVDDIAGFNEIILSISQIFFLNFFFRILEIFGRCAEYVFSGRFGYR